MTGSELDVYEQLADFVSANPDASDEEIKNKVTELGISEAKACAVLFQVVFDGSLNEEAIESKASLFQQFLSGEKAQKGILGGLERLVGELHRDLMVRVPMLLKALYDSELVEEDVFFKWEDRLSKRYVDKKVGKEIRAKAAPFLTWLKEAEEEEDED